LFYQYARNERNRRELVRQRMSTIVEMNHHIRNALQVIKFWSVQHQNCNPDEAQIQLVRDSVDRIEWALREVLPRYPESGTSASQAVQSQSAAPSLDSRAMAVHGSKITDPQDPR